VPLRNYSIILTLSQFAVSTGLGDRLRQAYHLGMLTSHAAGATQPPILSGTEIEYRPNGGDALRLESNSTYG